MRVNSRAMAIAGISAAALVATACGGGDSSSDSGSGGGEGQAGGSFSIHGCTPQNPLVPGNTNETCGGNILDAVTAKLVHYNPETAEPENDLAESIETEDNQTFTVKLKEGRKFSDGTDVTAKSFVDAWNWNRAGKNATLSSYFFDVIDGAADMDCGTKKEKDKESGEMVDVPDCEGSPAKADEMSGLKVVDDTTFTIKTTEKVSNLPVRLGYTAFAPLPESFFEDDGKAFGDKPVGAGPYMVKTYDKGQQVVLEKNPEYTGDFAGNADEVTFKFYQDTDAAYKDVQAGTLDILDQLPTSALAGKKYEGDLPDRTEQKATGVFQSISFPSPKADKTFEDNLELRKAISMAIDRDTIIDKIFAGTRQPATGWVSPAVDGYKEGACGDACTYDKAKAKEMFDQAGGYDGTITISYNADGDHKAWVDATCSSITDALGVKCVGKSYPDFATMRALVTDKKMKGLFRTGWQMDYPSIENFLAPLYGTGAGSNDGDYSSEKFDTLLKEAAAGEDAEAANTKYQEAEAELANGFPVIPLWYGQAIAGWSDKVDNVKLTPFGTIDVATVTVK
ncbi:ABC transporter substrate-binding protein [Janibacter melonis]|uniref:ABC transporter substrate-binding protein n=2 Tax=Janibacter melonis TaxID=262209 RepID=A0A176Q9T8_9MICO|nr:ABC transporter substrate-binding protein [Janibacter melonis]OAB86478.1 peptide ABC transporter substrate-binding protein [Janibacter melonis]QFQ30794.2 ABC transporter substrate-binding protein [Janibacter melonis]